MENLPIYIYLLFVAVTLLSVYLFYRIARPYKIVLAVVFLWLSLQAILSLNGFYTKWNTVPPRLVLILFPPLFFIVLSFLIPNFRKGIDNMNQKSLTLIHIVRIPVEFTLLLLFLRGSIPELMTFEGRNFDVVSGITAPLVIYFGYTRKRMSRSLLLAWNFICLGLLLNVVIHAILAMPTSFQKVAFDQPNVAVAYFPFVWLPAFIVPLVLFAHLVTIRQLLNQKQSYRNSEVRALEQVATV